MLTRSHIVILFIMVLIVLLLAWSRLRYDDDGDHAPQRVRVEDHPAFQKK